MFHYLQNYIASKLDLHDEEGQGTIEYVLVLGVLVVGIFSLLTWTSLGTALNDALGDVTALFSAENNPIS